MIMRSNLNPRSNLLSLAMLLGLVFLGTNAFAADATRVDKESSKNFTATVKAVETALQSQGFMIVAKIDHQNMLQMVGARIKGATTVEFGKPDMGKMLLPMAPDAGLEFPGRYYVWERADGKTVVSYRRPSAALDTYGNEMLSTMGRDMDGMWDMIATEATK